MAALHSHYKVRHVSVHEVINHDLRGMFQNRLTIQAAAELEILATQLQQVELTQTGDKRSCFFEGSNHKLVSGLIYKASNQEDRGCPSSPDVALPGVSGRP